MLAAAQSNRPCLQQARVSQRDAALDDIVRAATAPPPSKGSGLGLGPDRMHVRPLQAVDASGPKVRCWGFLHTAMSDELLLLNRRICCSA